MVKVEDADTYTIANVSRDTTGEYKCSLVNNPSLEASKEVTVNCKKLKYNILYRRNYATRQQRCQCDLLSVIFTMKVGSVS